MTTCRFLVDECVSADFIRGVRAHEPAIEIQQVGERGAPRKGTLDAEPLLICESKRLALLSTDPTTLPLHVTEHVNKGHHTYGVFVLRPGASFSEILEDLRLMHGASSAEEWIDCFRVLPFHFRAGRPV